MRGAASALAWPESDAAPRWARHEGKDGDVFEVTARVKIRDGELDGFKRQAAEIMRLARELDTKTLRYDWFLNDDGTECEVREGYVDADALLEHANHVGGRGPSSSATSPTTTR
jgi:hypothetical protein